MTKEGYWDELEGTDEYWEDYEYHDSYGDVYYSNPDWMEDE